MVLPLLIGFAPPRYRIDHSLRVRAANGAHLSRAFSASNRKTWTVSFWCKFPSKPGAYTYVFYSGLGTSGLTGLGMTGPGSGTDDKFRGMWNGASVFETGPLFRDPGGWQHVVVAVDTTQATPALRYRLYVNGAEVTSFSYGPIWPAQNSDGGWNAADTANVGGLFAGYYTEGYFAEIVSVDGLQLAPSAFGQADTATGAWVPRRYAGAYGTNGFHLEFKDATAATAAAIGKDSSSNGNHWTPNNISVSADASFDQSADTPTENHATLDPLHAGTSGIVWGALRSGSAAVRATQPVEGCAAYWEVTAGGSAVTAGTISTAGATTTTNVAANKVFGFRVSAAGALDFRNVTDNGAWTAIATASGEIWPYGTGAQADWNFGQRPFAGAVPAGYAPVSTRARASNAVKTGGSFTGNASADGPVIWTGHAPATLTINGNAVTWGTHADRLAGGFKLRTSSAAYNASGTNNWAATVAAPFVGVNRVPSNAQAN